MGIVSVTIAIATLFVNIEGNPITAFGMPLVAVLFGIGALYKKNFPRLGAAGTLLSIMEIGFYAYWYGSNNCRW